MNTKISISASLLSANFLHLQKEIEDSEKAGVDSFHLDVMDGHLVPNISYGPPIIKHMRKATKLPLDAHLMIDNPWLYLDDYIQCEVQTILVHAEAYAQESLNIDSIKTESRKTSKLNLSKIKEDLQYIKKNKIEAGITINPDTDIECIESILPYCDSVLVMSVNPGFSGQAFIPDVLEKIKRLRKIFIKNIKIDGGINNQTAPLAIQAGADTLITASYLYGSADYAKAVKSLKENSF